MDLRIVYPWRGVELRLQLSCRYVSNLSLLSGTPEFLSRFEDLCTSIRFVLHGSQVSTPTMKKLRQLHLRLFFNYVSNLERLQNEIPAIQGYSRFYTKISLIYDGDKLLRAQTVATKSKGSDWETDETFIEQGYAEWAIGRQQADRVAVSESV